MRSAHVRLLALTFVFLLARALPLKAQTLAGVEQGIKPYGSYEGGDVDSVSMANGSLTLNLPLISYPQRGGKLNVGFNLVYANPWLQPWASHCNPFNHFCSNTGYNLVYFTDPSTCGYTNPSGGTCGTAMSVPASFARSIGEVYQGPQCCPQTVRYFTVTEPDGSVHELGGSAPARSVDATGYAFWPGTDPNTGTLDTAGRLYDRQGNLYDFTTGQPGKVEDPNGNLVTATTTGWTDTMGRAIPAPSGATSTTDLSHCPSSATTAKLWSPPGPNGATSQYKFCWATINISFTPPDCGRSCAATSTTATEMVGIVLPNLTVWAFAYDSFGELTSITLPTGGTIAYTWTYINGDCIAPQYVEPTSGYPTLLWPYRRSITSRTVNANDGTGPHTWNYNYPSSIGNTGQTVSTDPLGNDTVHTETAIWGCSIYETQTDRYAGSHTGGTLLQTTTTSYNYHQGGGSVFFGNVAINVVPNTITTTDVASGKVSKVVKTYDSATGYAAILGDLLSESDYDFGSGSAGGLLRTTTNTYMALSGPSAASYLANNLVSLPYTTQVNDGSGNQLSLTQYNYDETARGSSGLTSSDQFDSNPWSGTYRGNNTSVYRWLNSGTFSCPNGHSGGSSGYIISKNSFFDDGMLNTAADPCGNTTTYAYNLTYWGALPTTVTNALNQSTMNAYDFNTGLLTSTTDPNNLVTNYGPYDSMWRLTQVNHPDGGQDTIAHQETTFPFSATLTSKINSTQNKVETNVFDGFGRVTQNQLTSDPQGTVYTDTTYDALGRVSTTSNPHRSSSSSTDGTTAYAYDALDRTSAVTMQDGSAVNTLYDETGANTPSTCTTVVDEAGKFRKSCSDGLGRLIEVDEPGAGATSSGAPGTGTIGVSGSPESVTINPCQGYPPPGNNCPTTIYDSGTVYVTVNGFQVSAGYGGSSNMAATIASELTTGLNASGSPVSASLNGTTITITSRTIGSGTDFAVSSSTTWNTQYFSSPSYTAGSAGMSGGTDPGMGSNPLVTLYAYDANNNLTCAVQKGTDTTAFTTCAAASATWRPRSFVYDSLSRLISATNPESGTITYAYDPIGNLSSKVAPAPNQTGSATVTTTYTYDALNRLTQKSYSDGSTPTVQYAYDGNSLTGCTYGVPTLSDSNPIGRRTAMCDGSGATHWALDITANVGWKNTEARNTAGITNTIVSQNNLGGMLYQLTYPSGRVIAYTPNAAARYVSAVDSANSINYAQNAAYAPPGELTSMTNGSAPITVTNAYNERLQPVTLSAGTSASTIMSLSYDFHRANGDNGNVFQIVNNRDNNRNQTFTYDSLNRIATAQTQSTSGPACWGESFTIDNWGNLTNKTPSQCVAESLNAPATNSNQISGYCYDKAGNLLGPSACPNSTYSYDGENRLLSTAGVTYTYDGDGNRVKKSNGTLYWGTGPLAESDLSGNMQREYIFFNGKRIARRDVSGNTVHYYFSDHLGSTSMTTDAVGTMSLCTNSPLGYTTVTTGEDESDYFPYGGERQLCNRAPQNYKFTGKERDTESGLDNFGARYFTSSMGRFMTPDWAARPTTVPYAVFGDPQSLNLYNYVRNDPISRIDPDGHYEVNASGCSGNNQAKCQKKYDKKIDNIEKARQKDLKSKDPNVRAAAASYGDRGEKNGVHVGVANLGAGIKGSVDDKSGLGKTDIDVTINSNLGGKSLQETVAHEGSHVGDDQKYDSSPVDAFGNHDPSLNLTHGQTEFNAYKTGAGVDREHGFGPNDDQKIRDFIKNNPIYAPIIDDPTHTPED